MVVSVLDLYFGNHRSRARLTQQTHFVEDPNELRQDVSYQLQVPLGYPLSTGYC
jgi:hypothetical protein